MWITDLFLALPQLAAAVAGDLSVPGFLKNLVGPEGGVFILIVMVIGGFRWMPVARLVRPSSCPLREKEFVEAARALGATTPRLVIRHILPNSLGPVIVAGTIDVAAAIIAEIDAVVFWASASTRYSDLGRLLFDAKDYLDIAPHWALFAGAAIFLTVLAINFIGDGLRDALIPGRSCKCRVKRVRWTSTRNPRANPCCSISGDSRLISPPTTASCMR